MITYGKLSDIYDFQYGKGNTNPDNGGTYPIYGSNGVIGGYDKWNSEDAPVIGHIGANCGSVVWASGKHFVTYNGVICQIKNNASAKYGYYALLTSNLKSRVLGSAQPFISYHILNRVVIYLPPIEIQNKIASILSAYDNLIENNNKRIKILEQMAENLYKEWFVRFRFPGHETTPIENGIPRGWTVQRMNDFCYVTDGTHDSPKPVEEGVPLITGKCISNGFIDFDEAYFISLKDHENIKKRSGLSTGDILFSNIGTVGNCCIVNYNQEFSVKNVIIFKPNNTSKTAYLYYWMLNDSMQAVFATQTNGASQQFVGLNFMRRHKILVPELKVLTAFGNIIKPIIEQKNMLQKTNDNLIKQRDLLLPRLMSGKLAI